MYISEVIALRRNTKLLLLASLLNKTFGFESIHFESCYSSINIGVADKRSEYRSRLHEGPYIYG